MQLTPEQQKQIVTVTVSTLLSFAVAILAILGYNIVIVQPQLAALGIETSVGPGGITIQAAPYNISSLPQRCKKSGINCVEIWNGSDIQVFSDGGSTQTFLVDGATGDVTARGLTTSANPLFPSESITPTDSATITPTMRTVTLTPAAAVTVTLGACTTKQETLFYNANNFAVIIQDTGNFIGAGNQTLGQYDAMPARCIDSKWVQVGPVSSN